MLLYFLIICATEFLIVNYGSHAAGIINITTTRNATEITVGPVNSHTTNETTTLTEVTAMGNVLSIIKGQKLSTAETSAHKISKPTPSNPNTLLAAAETVPSSLTREERTLRRLFPFLLNVTANTDAPGLLGDNGLLPLLLTNLLSNDNVGVIAASLISALRDRTTTTAATNDVAAIPTTASVQNITNNFYTTSSYPYYYAGNYSPYGYYYG
ncbi:uncharacterized protein LOC128919829 [Zeugodacus cucurbitae]|uniref:uncharacterized protein LOC128919829 n=1 Tax=Zeugodacus cucurbitae TaxID=28588 RepID=UPI0023D92E23|nr:uncharacterized protein LOC128919829 [Zeugodacus cucurbitae]